MKIVAAAASTPGPIAAAPFLAFIAARTRRRPGSRAEFNVPPPCREPHLCRSFIERVIARKAAAVPPRAPAHLVRPHGLLDRLRPLGEGLLLDRLLAGQPLPAAWDARCNLVPWCGVHVDCRV